MSGPYPAGRLPWAPAGQWTTSGQHWQAVDRHEDNLLAERIMHFFECAPENHGWPRRDMIHTFRYVPPRQYREYAQDINASQFVRDMRVAAALKTLALWEGYICSEGYHRDFSGAGAFDCTVMHVENNAKQWQEYDESLARAICLAVTPALEAAVIQEDRCIS